MSKKIVLAVFGVLLILVAGGGVFWWWQYQKDVRELNKNLPEGVRVVKNLAGEYRVVNKIDGYEFKAPEEWRGLKEVEFYEEEEGYPGITGLALEGFEGAERELGIILYKLDIPDRSLKSWVEERFKRIGLSEAVQFREFKVETIDVMSVKAEEYFVDFVWYFFKNDQKIYEVDNVSEELVREIITNGKW